MGWKLASPLESNCRAMLLPILRTVNVVPILMLAVVHILLPPSSPAAPDSKPPVAPRGKDRVDALGDPLPELALFRIGTTRLQHHGQVQAIAASPDGRYLASTGTDKLLKVWDATDGRPIREFALPTWGPWAIAFSADSKELAAVSRAAPGVQGAFRRWDLKSGRELSGSTDTSARSAGFSYHVALVCRDDGKYLAAETAEANIFLYSPGDPRSGKNLKGHSGRMMCLSFTKDAKTLVSLDDGGMIRFWNTDDGKEIAQLSVPAMKDQTLKGNLAFVAVAPDAKLLAVTLPDETTRLIDSDGHELRRLPTSVQMSALTFSPTGRALLTGSNAIEMWNVADAKPIPLLGEGRHPIRDLALSPDGKLAAFADNQTRVRFADVATGKLLARRDMPCSRGIAFSPVGPLFAVALPGNTIAFWDVAVMLSAEPLPVKPAMVLRCQGKVKAFALSPDGKRLATVEDGRVARIYDTSSKKMLLTIKPTGRALYAVRFSPDGRFLVAIGEQPYFHLGQDKPIVPQAVGIWDTTNGFELSVPDDLRELAHTVRFHPNGKSLTAIHLPVYTRKSKFALGVDARSIDQSTQALQWEERMETIRTWEIGGKSETLRFEDPIAESSPKAPRAGSPGLAECRRGVFAGRCHLRYARARRHRSL